MQKLNINICRAIRFNSPTLVSYVQNYKGKYKAIIPITMVYPPVYYAALYAAEKGYSNSHYAL